MTRFQHIRQHTKAANQKSRLYTRLLERYSSRVNNVVCGYTSELECPARHLIDLRDAIFQAKNIWLDIRDHKLMA